MQPGLYQLIPHNGGKPLYAIVKYYAKHRLKMRLVDFESPGRRPSPLVPVQLALWFGRFVPLVPDPGYSRDAAGVGRQQSPGMAECGKQLIQPYYQAFDEYGSGLWYGHSTKEILQKPLEPTIPHANGFARERGSNLNNHRVQKHILCDHRR